jgi:hypothetical protein
MAAPFEFTNALQAGQLHDMGKAYLGRTDR